MKFKIFFVTLFFLIGSFNSYSQDNIFGLVVHFEYDSTKLSKNELIKIDSFLEKIHDIGDQVIVYTYTDSLGRADYNRKLSLKRAKTIHNYISSKLPEMKIFIKGAGEDTLFIDQLANDKGYWKNRRGEIIVLTKEFLKTYSQAESNFNPIQVLPSPISLNFIEYIIIEEMINLKKNQ